MLIIKSKLKDKIIIDGNIEIEIKKIGKNQIALAIKADQKIKIEHVSVKDC